MNFARLRFALAVLVARLPTARSNLPDPRTLVLQPDDLPSGWQYKGTRTFRTGLTTRTDWAQRLCEAIVSCQVV